MLHIKSNFDQAILIAFTIFLTTVPIIIYMLIELAYLMP